MTSIDLLVCLFYATIVQEIVIVPQNRPNSGAQPSMTRIEKPEVLRTINYH